ncbi:hypothetical protein ACFWM0_22935 [Streptomyces sp. NPDC058405]|uniref:hypothetical protein n=1 Tax=Streptomyces sp. NPDC058405 TaxID=3346482 RepID=UPI00365F4B03
MADHRTVKDLRQGAAHEVRLRALDCGVHELRRHFDGIEDHTGPQHGGPAQLPIQAGH